MIIKAECPGGCPCFDYDCDDFISTSIPLTTTTTSTSTTTEKLEKAVLLLDNRNADNLPMVISFDGEVDDDIEFQFIGDSFVRGGCSATLNGKFFYFGGSTSKHQSKVSDL